MQCPYCAKEYDDKDKLAEHSLYCDLNPEVQRTLPDMVGLTYEYNNSLVKIIEVVPGELFPIYVSALMKDTVLGSVCWTQMYSQLHYASVMNRTFGKEKKYNDIAKRMIENIERTMR